ncbi:putative homing endonuclease [Plesiomonas phage phiP4-7]|nr:putative homing endonuclease [Plesiomonas phage phiP4-7]
MNYQAIYSDLIAKRKSKKPRGYSEKHHIIPRCLGGSDDRNNLVMLTAREHFIAHRLLAKVHGGRLWAAVAMMSRAKTKSANGVAVTSRTYEIAKRKDAEWRSEFYRGANNPWYGKAPSNETLDKMRKPRINKENLYGRKIPHIGWVVGMVNSYNPRAVSVNFDVMNTIHDSVGIFQSVNCRGNRMTIKRNGLARLGRYFRAMTIERTDISGANNPNYGNGQAISGCKNPMWGKEHKQSTKDKIAEKAKRRITCPHCGKTGSISNMHRWHFDNCKVKND